MLPDLEKYYATVPGRKFTKRFRADWWDYRSKGAYMVTVMKHEGIPNFSDIVGEVRDEVASARSYPTRLGHHIRRAILAIPKSFEEVRILQYILMPDHLHILIEVRSRVSYHLGEVVRKFKSDCRNRYSYILAQDYDFSFDGSVFYDGYDDLIINKKNQLGTVFDYIKDNPRRLFLRKTFPEYFRNVLLAVAGEVRFGLYGNINLLEHPVKDVVRFSRRFSEEELKRRKRTWLEIIRCGGVLVSPFIHPVEKEVLKYALANGGKCIVIRDNGFAPRWKPPKGMIDYCSEGRLLFVGPEEYKAAKIQLTRQLSMQLNGFAEEIARFKRGDFSLRRFLPFSRG